MRKRRYSAASCGSIITRSATRRHSSWNVSCDSTWNVLMTPYPLMSIFTSGFVSPTLGAAAPVLPVCVPAPPGPITQPHHHTTTPPSSSSSPFLCVVQQTGQRLLWRGCNTRQRLGWCAAPCCWQRLGWWASRHCVLCSQSLSKKEAGRQSNAKTTSKSKKKTTKTTHKKKTNSRKGKMKTAVTYPKCQTYYGNSQKKTTNRTFGDVSRFVSNSQPQLSFLHTSFSLFSLFSSSSSSYNVSD